MGTDRKPGSLDTYWREGCLEGKERSSQLSQESTARAQTNYQGKKAQGVKPVLWALLAQEKTRRISTGEPNM